MKDLFRKIKKVDKLLQLKEFEGIREIYSDSYLMDSIKLGISITRKKITEGQLTDEASIDSSIISNTFKLITLEQKPKLQKVLNCTGTVLHTNLGRAILSKKAKENLYLLADQYSNLELNLDTGKRGSRYDHITDLLKKLTGCEDALVVNNNAAAVLLILTALSKGKESIVSRGELVEIGGSFRIPNVMDFGGAILKEVGTTNKTHLFDYEDAINKNTALMVKVHNSNYTINGFTKTITAEELVPLSKKKRVPIYYDLGSGALFDFTAYGINEPTVKQLITSGVDILSFSGDKLLGGPQGGIIVGKKKLIDIIKKNQFLRAVRVDKLTLSALEGTLLEYLDMEKVRIDNPTINMLTISLEELKEKALLLSQMFKQEAIVFSIKKINSLSGGGSLPDKMFPSYSLVLADSEGISIPKIVDKLRFNTIPIIVRVKDNQLIMDLRTIKDEDFKMLVAEFSRIYHGEKL
ncbi:MAG: L-seryl-tRNA(Sec) selenium transferase [Fusobacteria bacterium]|nr:MAG: L-seryl-tRNA(Sec) selenium transferase [Fusobacteriota bacterium]KAF0228909.1 MAG: L-seryl-tRNA(Sec) selenium [Fusobacteriota bacterium]